MSTLMKYRVQVFGASVDPVDLNRQFSEKNHYNFVLLSDPEKHLAKALGVLTPDEKYARRWTYVIDADGVIRDIDMKVAVAHHGKDLAAKLEALGVPEEKAD